MGGAESAKSLKQDVSGFAKGMADEDVIMLSADVERMLKPAVAVSEEFNSANDDDSDVKTAVPVNHGKPPAAADEFTPDELFGLMESSEPKAALGDFVVQEHTSPGGVLPAHEPQAKNLARPNSVPSPTAPHPASPVTETFRPLADGTTHHGQAFDTNELPMVTAQPTASVSPAAFNAAQMAQPNFVQVPIPQPTMPLVEDSGTKDCAAVESAEDRLSPPTRLPPPSATSKSDVQSRNEEAKTELPVAKSDKQAGTPDSESAGDGATAVKELAVATKQRRKRLDRSIEKARKDLLLLQDPLPEKLPRKISKLLAELETVDAKPEELLVRRIAATRSNAVVGPLEIHFVEAPENVRIAIANSLAQIPDAASTAALLNMLREKSASVVEAASVVKAAIRSLVLLGRDESLLPLLYSALVSASNRSVLQAAMLEKDDKTQADFADRLKKFLNHKDDNIAVVAVGLISSLHGESRLKLYSKLLTRESEALRAAALEALGQSGENQAVQFLNAAMKDESAVVRAAAATGLTQIHSPKSSVLLMHGLQDPEVRVRRNCAKALTQIEDERIAKGVALVLKKETDPAAIEYLLQALGKNGSQEALVTLRKYLDSDDKRLIQRALTTMKRLRERKGAKLILPFLDHEDSDLRRLAVEALGLCQDPSVLAQLCEVLKGDKVPAVCTAAARALGELKDENAIPILEEALYEDRNTKCQAVIALGKLKSTTSIPALLVQLRDPASEVRYHACVALGQMGELPNPELLRELLDDKDPMVQRGAKAALEKLGVSYKSGRIGSKLRKVAASLVPSSLAGGLPLGATAVAGLVVGVLGYAGYAFMNSGFAGFGGPPLRIGDVQHVSVSPDGKLVSVSRKFKVFETWDLGSGEIIQRMELKRIATGIQFTDASKILVFAGGGAASLETNAAATADSAIDTLLKSLSTHRVAMTPDGAMAAFVGFAGDTQIVDLRSRKTVGKRFKIKNFEKESSVAITNDGSLLLIGGMDGRIEVFSPEKGASVGSISLANVLNVNSVSLSSLALDSNSTYLATGTVQGKVLVFNLNDGMKLMGIPHEGKKEIVQLSFMGTQVVYANSAGRFGVCDAEFSSSRTLKVFLSDRPERVSFSLDGRVAVVQFDENKKFAAVDIPQDKLLLDVNKTAE